MRYALAIWLFMATASQAAVTQFWKLDDNAASTTVVATTGTNATLAGGDNTSVKQTGSGPGGSITYAFDLNGSDDYVDFAASAVSFADGAAFSVSAWVNLDALTAEVLVGRAGSATRYVRVDTSTSIRVYIGGATADYTVPTMSTGTWYHLLITRAATSNSTRVFLNGTESSTGAQTQSGAMDLDAIGRTSLAFGDGRISQVRIYNSDESANVATIYAEGVDSGIVHDPIVTPESGLDTIIK